jgi:hypothetical protein
MSSYQGYCNDCGWMGMAEHEAAAARFDALAHAEGHNDVEVREITGHGFTVIWRSTDGLGEDGQVHIH